jgi:hypothetical protein
VADKSVTQRSTASFRRPNKGKAGRFEGEPFGPNRNSPLSEVAEEQEISWNKQGSHQGEKWDGSSRRDQDLSQARVRRKPESEEAVGDSMEE